LQSPDDYFLDMDLHEKKLKALNQKLLTMLQWCESDDCRAKQIHAYFGASTEACGKCDNCKGTV